jgi:hypothetical protein
MGLEFRVNQHAAGYQGHLVSPAVTAAGDFAIAWADSRDALWGGFPLKVAFTILRFYDAQGRPRTGEIYAGTREGNDTSNFPIWLGCDSLGRFLLFWEDGWFSHVYPGFEYKLRSYSEQGIPGEGPFSRPALEPSGELIYQIQLLPSGDLWLLWAARRGDFEGREVLARRMTPEGEFLGQPTSLALDPVHPTDAGGFGLDGVLRPIVTWSANCGDYPYFCDVFGQRLSAEGEKLGVPVQLNSSTGGLQLANGVGVAPDGSFLAVWQSDHPHPYAVLGRHFSSALKPTGGEFLISPDDPQAFPRTPRVATDAAGRAVVVWGNFRRENGVYGWDVLARAYAPDGREITRRPLRLNQRHSSAEFPNESLSFGGNGTFVAAWESTDSDWNGIFAQRFAFWPGNEACVRRGAQVLCDTGRRGGDAEFSLAGLGLEQGGTLVFGDVDGDGRADPCVRVGRRLSCDTDHFGAPFERSIVFGSGKPQEEIFVADVNRDGTAEACVHQGSAWECDTGHNGGKAELRFTYGSPGEQGLMGDVDGDGRADACSVRKSTGRLYCDTGHGRANRETVLEFPPGGVAGSGFLGDFDGDGRADLCIYRDGTFLCDTRRDGGMAGTLRFGEPGDRPLLVNLDGF